MTASPEHSDLEAIRCRSHQTTPCTHMAGTEGHDMLPKDNVGFRHSLIEAVVDHGLRPSGALLVGLEEGDEGTAPFIPNGK